MDVLRKIFSETDLGVCIKDRDARVLYQNRQCQTLCGDQHAQTCDKSCMQLYRRYDAARGREEGTQYYPCQVIDGHYFDIVLLTDSDYLISFLCPLSDKHNADLAYFSQWNLTRREMEVVSLVIKGMTNRDIAETLFISRGTLKNHLKNIYAKLPEHVIAPWR